jgi:sugar O-acyltransferase (sialic acid O-acetyltransferase NeuD family)
MTIVNQEEIVIFGAGGHAKVIIDIVEKQEIYKIVSLVDDNADLLSTKVYGYTVIDDLNTVNNERCTKYIIAIGDNHIRQRIHSNMINTKFDIAQPAIHPSSQLARGVKIGNGTVLMAGTVINSDTIIAENVIINTNAAIDHDCYIESGVHIAPGSTLCGGVSIGRGTFVGAGTTIQPSVKIGANVVVGAGSTVLADVPDNVTVFGTPAEIKG